MSDNLGSRKYERIKELKTFKKIANKTLEDNIELRKQSHPAWMNKTLEQNVSEIRHLIQLINDDLGEDMLAIYFRELENKEEEFLQKFVQLNTFTFLGRICN